MAHVIDARGLTCPQPVVLTKKAMSDHSSLEILVDNETALENLKRLTGKSGWSFSSTETGGYFKIITSGMSGDVSVPKDDVKISTKISSGKPFITVLSSNKMGRGNDDLGAILIRAFLHTLTEADDLPQTVVLYNEGVKLAADDSDVADDLRTLEGQGTEILVCGTCVDFFGIKDQIHVGIISNMYDIVEAMSSAGRTLAP